MRVSDGLDPVTVGQIAASVGASVERKVASWDLYLFRFDEKVPVSEVVSKLQSRPEVQYAEPNVVLEALGSKGSTKKGLDPEIASGTPVIVAVIDTDIDYSHSAFSGSLYSNPGEIAGDGIDNDSNGYVDDTRGYDFFNHDNDASGSSGAGAHGTQVAGRVLAGALDTAVSILPLRVGPGPSLSLASVVEAIDYATRMGARVINMSFGTTTNVASLQEAVSFAASHNVLLVAAAGNGGDTQNNYPAAYDEVISVAATNAAGQKSSFSTYGKTVDFSAPGENVSAPTWGGGTTTVNGTSFSSPFVAGVLAQLVSAFPDLSAKKLLKKLKSFVKKIDSLNIKAYRGKLGDGFIDEEVAEDVADATSLDVQAEYLKETEQLLVQLQALDFQLNKDGVPEGLSAESVPELVLPGVREK